MKTGEKVSNVFGDKIRDIMLGYGAAPVACKVQITPYYAVWRNVKLFQVELIISVRDITLCLVSVKV